VSKSKACKCAYCKHDIDFKLDTFLIEEMQSGNVVIFAGAGVSTENSNSAPHSLYAELAVKCGIENCTLPFPDLTQKFVERRDGKFELIKCIQERFDYISKFADLRQQATKFYQELATMPYLRTFITTNWDKHFEEYCHAKPFVYDADTRFWNIPLRQVLKIHGTIDDYSSLVATREEYDQCLIDLQKSLIGAKLKDLLTTKTCIFIGYSMEDDDFKEIFEFVRTAQGKFAKIHYFVSPSVSDETTYDNVCPIKTDGTYFLRVIKEHLCSIGGYLDDDIYQLVQEELNEVRKEHLEFWEKYNPKVNPQMLLSAFYQDGLIHGYQMVRDMRKTGQYSDPSIICAKIQGYEEKVREYRSKKDYLNLAYFRGYQNVLIALTFSVNEDELLWPPRYYYEKHGEMDRTEFEEVFMQLPRFHKTAFKQCKKSVAHLPEDGSMVLDHSAWG
jgi:hypothetical protein